MSFLIKLFVYVTILDFSFSLEWTTHSLLQLGPCPSSSSLMSPLDINQMRGKWTIEHLPQPFPQCCRSPILSFAEDIPKKLANETHQQLKWLSVGIDFSGCDDHPDMWRSNNLNWRLWNNKMNEGTFVIDLPWPFNAVGFSTFNIVSTDYKKYAAGYVCHSFLLEHIAIPFIMVRPRQSMDFQEWQRIKWIFIKQGVLSAWTLTETKGFCNEIADSSTTKVEGEYLHHDNHSESSEVYHVNIEGNNHSTSVDLDESYLINTRKEENITLTSSMESDAEWITTNLNHDQDYYPPSTIVWPSIWMDHPSNSTESSNEDIDSKYVNNPAPLATPMKADTENPQDDSL